MDCSSVKCPENNCSDHGVCGSFNTSSTSDWLLNDEGNGTVAVVDVCHCDLDYTGADCSVPVHGLAPLPYGNIFDYVPYVDDEYGDNHPVFNLSTLFRLRVSLDPADLAYLLDPAYL